MWALSRTIVAPKAEQIMRGQDLGKCG